MYVIKRVGSNDNGIIFADTLEIAKEIIEDLGSAGDEYIIAEIIPEEVKELGD